MPAQISHHNFRLLECAPTFSTADSSAVSVLSQAVAVTESGDESPLSERSAPHQLLSQIEVHVDFRQHIHRFGIEQGGLISPNLYRIERGAQEQRVAAQDL